MPYRRPITAPIYPFPLINLMNMGAGVGSRGTAFGVMLLS
jgi:hypothetical protein